MTTLKIKQSDGTWKKAITLGSFDAAKRAEAAMTTAQNAASVAETKAGIATQKASDISASATQIETNRTNISLLKTYVTPEMFKNYEGDDWTQAIQSADTYAYNNSITLKLTGKTYNCGALTLLSSKIIGDGRAALSCNANVDTFVSYKNRYNTIMENVTFLGNGKANVVLDTSYDSVAPSCNIIFNKIRIEGHTNIGWLANNNNDVWLNGCQITRALPTDVWRTQQVVSYKNIGSGGPITIKDSTFLQGETHLSAQYISLINNVLRGVHFCQGGWNVVNLVGNYCYADYLGNNFTVEDGARLWGFTCNGTHIEDNLYNGNIIKAGSATIGTRAITFNGCHIFSDNNSLKMLDDSGVNAAVHPRTVVQINGGLFTNVELNHPNNYWKYVVQGCQGVDDVDEMSTETFSISVNSGITIARQKCALSKGVATISCVFTVSSSSATVGTVSAKPNAQIDGFVYNSTDRVLSDIFITTNGEIKSNTAFSTGKTYKMNVSYNIN